MELRRFLVCGDLARLDHVGVVPPRAIEALRAASLCSDQVKRAGPVAGDMLACAACTQAVDASGSGVCAERTLLARVHACALNTSRSSVAAAGCVSKQLAIETLACFIARPSFGFHLYFEVEQFSEVIDGLYLG